MNPGRYVVCEVLQATWTQSEPAGPDECAAVPGLGADGYAITVTSGSSDPGNEFGNFQQGTKSGKKYNDLNANGTRDAGEPGLSGWEIRAYADANGNGVVDAGETFVSTTTDASGDYSFSLNPGRYVVCEVLQATWTQSEPAGPDECAAVPGLGADGYAITVTSGSSDPGNEFGNFQNTTISGMKFKDADAGGDKDAGEIGLGGWVIHLFGPGGSLVATTTTAPDGTYSFTGLTPGAYVVCEQTSGQAGWVQSFPVSGSGDCTLQTVPLATLGDEGHAVTTTSGGTFGDRDFGNTPLSTVDVSFTSLATLPGGGDATHATEITCTDTDGNTVGTDDDNDLTTDEVKTSASALTCTITFVDP